MQKPFGNHWHSNSVSSFCNSKGYIYFTTVVAWKTQMTDLGTDKFQVYHQLRYTSNNAF